MASWGNIAQNLGNLTLGPSAGIAGLAPTISGASGLINSLAPNNSISTALNGAYNKISNASGSVFGGLLGTNGGVNGTGFKGPGTAPIQPGVTPDQLAGSYAGGQSALASQQALLAALQGQNGLGNQANALAQQQGFAQQIGNANGIGVQGSSIDQQKLLNALLANNNGAGNIGNVYNQSQDLASQLVGSNGVGNLSSALASQQQLARQQQGTAAQYQNIAAGRGPNPAMAALAQSTGQNVQNQAALMAGQRGAGANIGLIARQAAQQGAATQQQAVGQAATLQAQQSLNALSGLSAQQQAIGQTQQNVAGIAGQQVGMTQAQQQALAQQAANQVSQQQTGIQSQLASGQNLVAQQQAQQQAAANQANILAGQQIGATTANTQAQQSQQGILQQALSGYNQQQIAQQASVNAANAGLANTVISGQQGMLGGILNGAGTVIGAAEGGLIQKFADGTTETPVKPAPAVVGSAGSAQLAGPQSSWGKFLQGWSGNENKNNSSPNNNDIPTMSLTGPQALQRGSSNLVQGIFKKGTGTTSPGSFAGPDASSLGSASIMAASKGGVAKQHDYTGGGNVKAQNQKQKAVKAGNSYDNDKIPAMLSEGEIVIPRNVLQNGDPIRGAADFVSRVLTKRKGIAA